MTTAEILAAAANRLEMEGWAPNTDDASVSGAIKYVAPDWSQAYTALRYFRGFVRTDGIAWEREPGRTRAEVVRALRDAASQVSS